MTLAESGPAATELAVEAQTRFLGKLGEFGQPVIRKQADAIIAEFARNVASYFHSMAMAPQGAREQNEIFVSQPSEMEPPVSSAPLMPVRPLIGMAVGLGLALVLFITLPLPAPPLLAWSLVGMVTVGLTLLGAVAERSLRLWW